MTKVKSKHATSYETFQIRQFLSMGEETGGIRKGWRKEEVFEMGFDR